MHTSQLDEIRDRLFLPESLSLVVHEPGVLVLPTFRSSRARSQRHSDRTCRGLPLLTVSFRELRAESAARSQQVQRRRGLALVIQQVCLALEHLAKPGLELTVVGMGFQQRIEHGARLVIRLTGTFRVPILTLDVADRHPGVAEVRGIALVPGVSFVELLCRVMA